MKKLLLLVLLFVPMFTVNAQSRRFEITYPATASKEPIDGRLLLLISTNKDEEPRSRSAKI